MTKVLFVEDDESLAFLTKDNLEMQGYEVVHLSNGEDVLDEFKKQPFDICLLDVMLPGIDGFQIAKDIREVDHEVPLIFLTAKTMLEDRLEGLELGADDYVTKPFSMKELILRVKAILRRAKPASPVSYTFGDSEYDEANFQVKVAGKLMKLTARESDLLKLFVGNIGQTLTRSEILLKIWGSDDFFLGRSLDVFISRLRKIFKNSSKISIENVHGVGFKMKAKK